ncbi:MAG: glycosyltransferase family 9 protein [Chloroflexota bacterium]
MTDITVLRAGALGDVLLTLPALHALRARFPDARLRVVGYPSLWRVVGPLVDSVSSIDAPSFGGLLAGDPATNIPPVIAEADIVIAWTARDLRPALSSVAAQLVTASPYPPPRVHAATWLLSTLTPLGVSGPLFPNDVLGLAAGEKDSARRELSAAGLQHSIVLHPGAGAAWKCWPIPSFANLIAALQAQGRCIALLCGPADEKAIADLQERVPNPLPVIRQPDLRRLAALLSESRAFVGHDSGTTHLATLAGVPVVALFGPTDPANWAPLGAGHVLRHCKARAQAQGEIRVCHDPHCTEAIAVDEVVSALGIV